MGVTLKDRENRIDRRIADQKSCRPDLTIKKKADIDIWELNRKEREHMLTQIAEYRRRNKIRDWGELIFILGFIFYILYDIYKDGDLDAFFKFFTI